MALFKPKDVLRTKNIGSIEFICFNNTVELFELYSKRQKQFYFTNCFEYINKINLNSRYEVLYLDNLFLYIYDLKTNAIIAYNYESYLYMLDKHGKKLPIKFLSEEESWELNFVSTHELVDAVYSVDGLADMYGKKYLKLRQHRNNFVNRSGELSFIPYADKYETAVMNLYKSWKNNAKDNGNTFIVDAKIFKNGLYNDYLEKFILLNDGVIIGFISYFCVGEWCFVYSMKTLRTLRNANVYMVNVCWQKIRKDNPNVKYINLGSIDSIEWKDDFKMQLKPDILLKYYTNVEMG